MAPPPQHSGRIDGSRLWCSDQRTRAPPRPSQCPRIRPRPRRCQDKTVMQLPWSLMATEQPPPPHPSPGPPAPSSVSVSAPPANTSTAAPPPPVATPVENPPTIATTRQPAPPPVDHHPTLSSTDVVTLLVGAVAAVIAFLSWRAARRAAIAGESSAETGRVSAEAAKVSADAGKQSAEAADFSLIETQRLRRQQTQPHVLVYLAQRPDQRYVVDLVIRNIGQTTASDIEVAISPPPLRAIADQTIPQELWLPPSLPVLVPDQEWWTLWDMGNRRIKTDLPDCHEAVVTFSDIHGNGPDDTPGRFEYQYTLDWGIFKGQIGMKR